MVQRLKRKLQLRDRIAFIEDQITPISSHCCRFAGRHSLLVVTPR
jgi:hypothetical protein